MRKPLVPVLGREAQALSRYHPNWTAAVACHSVHRGGLRSTGDATAASRSHRANGRSPAPVYWMRSTGQLWGEIRQNQDAGFQLCGPALWSLSLRLLLPFIAFAIVDQGRL